MEMLPALTEISKIEFSGKFDVWQPVAYCMALCHFLTKSKTKKGEIQNCITQPASYKDLKFPNQGQAYLDKILGKESLQMAVEALDEAKSGGTEREVYESRVNVLSNLFLILAANNGKDQKLDGEIYILVENEVAEINKNSVSFR